MYTLYFRFPALIVVFFLSFFLSTREGEGLKVETEKKKKIIYNEKKKFSEYYEKPDYVLSILRKEHIIMLEDYNIRCTDAACMYFKAFYKLDIKI